MINFNKYFNFFLFINASNGLRGLLLLSPVVINFFNKNTIIINDWMVLFSAGSFIYILIDLGVSRLIFREAIVRNYSKYLRFNYIVKGYIFRTIIIFFSTFFLSQFFDFNEEFFLIIIFYFFENLINFYWNYLRSIGLLLKSSYIKFIQSFIFFLIILIFCIFEFAYPIQTLLILFISANALSVLLIFLFRKTITNIKHKFLNVTVEGHYRIFFHDLTFWAKITSLPLLVNTMFLRDVASQVSEIMLGFQILLILSNGMGVKYSRDVLVLLENNKSELHLVYKWILFNITIFFLILVCSIYFLKYPAAIITLIGLNYLFITSSSPLTLYYVFKRKYAYLLNIQMLTLIFILLGILLIYFLSLDLLFLLTIFLIGNFLVLFLYIYRYKK